MNTSLHAAQFTNMYVTDEQMVVVEYRKSIGYDGYKLPNGNWMIWKGRHQMEINCLGYDCYHKVGTI